MLWMPTLPTRRLCSSSRWDEHCTFLVVDRFETCISDDAADCNILFLLLLRLCMWGVCVFSAFLDSHNIVRFLMMMIG